MPDKRPVSREEIFRMPSPGRVFAGGAWMMMSFLPGILVFVWMILAGRPEAFGPAGIEFYTTAWALAALCSLPALGISNGYAKFVAEAYARGKKAGRKAAAKASTVLLLVGSGVTILFLAYVLFGVTDPFDRVSFSIVGIAIPLIYLHDVFNSMNMAMGRFDYAGMVAISMSVGTLASGAVFLAFFRDFAYAPYLSSTVFFAALLMVLVAFYFFRKSSPFSLGSLAWERLDGAFAKEFSAFGGWCVLANLAAFGVTIPLSIFMAKLLIAERALVGVYAIAANYAWVMMLITFMAFPLVPELSRAKEVGDRRLMESLVRLGHKFALPMGVITVLIFLLLGKPILYTFNGPDYVLRGGVAPLVITIAGMTLYGVGSISVATLVGLGRARAAGAICGLSHLLIVCSTPLLVPSVGLVGPSLAVLISGAFALPLLTWKAGKALGTRPEVATILRPVGAGLFSAAIGFLFIPSAVGLGGGLGGFMLILGFGILLGFLYLSALAFGGHFDELDYKTIEDTAGGIHPNLRSFGRAANRFLKSIARVSPFAPKP